jgi:hypothetical protein
MHFCGEIHVEIECLAGTRDDSELATTKTKRGTRNDDLFVWREEKGDRSPVPQLPSYDYYTDSQIATFIHPAAAAA